MRKSDTQCCKTEWRDPCNAHRQCRRECWRGLINGCWEPGGMEQLYGIYLVWEYVRTSHLCLRMCVVQCDAVGVKFNAHISKVY